MPDEAPERANQHLLAAALYYNSFRTIAHQAAATGFRSSVLKHRAGAAGVDAPAQHFLINSRLHRNDRETSVSIEEYFSDPGVVLLSMLGREPDDPVGDMPLPESIVLPMAFSQVVAQRRSRRNFTGDRWSLAELATVLRCAAGVTGRATVPLLGGGDAELRFRASPSGGGLYPVDLYVVAVNVGGLERGIYRYAPVPDRLVHCGGKESADAFLNSSITPADMIPLESSAAVIALVGYPARAMRKYGARGLRLALLEAGAIAGQIGLTVTALGHGSVDSASFVDDEANAALDCDGEHQSLLHAIVVGSDA